MKYPRVIAIGNQSSGKSSILESIVGKTFLPCGPDMVTKCPLFVRKVLITFLHFNFNFMQ